MLEIILVVALGVLAWVMLKLFRGKADGDAAQPPRRGAGGKDRALGATLPPPPDPVTALGDLPRRLHIEYRLPEGGVLRSDVDVEALEQRDGHLWVVGHCQRADAPQSFRADRIAAFTDRHNNAVFKGDRARAALEAAAQSIAAQEAVAQVRGEALDRESAGARDAARAAAARLASERARALDAFREWATRDDWVLMACNASGRDAQAEIVEVAVISAAGAPLLQQRVLPQGPVSDTATARHGLTAEALRGAPIWPRLHRDVTATLAAAPYVLSYNALFQLRLLEQTAARYDLTLPELEFDCVMQAYAAFRAEPGGNGEARRHSLADAAAHEGVAEDDRSAPAGSALAEALTAWRLIRKLGAAAAP